MAETFDENNSNQPDKPTDGLPEPRRNGALTTGEDAVSSAQEPSLQPPLALPASLQNIPSPLTAQQTEETDNGVEETEGAVGGVPEIQAENPPDVRETNDACGAGSKRVPVGSVNKKQKKNKGKKKLKLKKKPQTGSNRLANIVKNSVAEPSQREEMWTLQTLHHPQSDAEGAFEEQKPVPVASSTNQQNGKRCKQHKQSVHSRRNAPVIMQCSDSRTTCRLESGCHNLGLAPDSLNGAVQLDLTGLSFWSASTQNQARAATVVFEKKKKKRDKAACTHQTSSNDSDILEKCVACGRKI